MNKTKKKQKGKFWQTLKIRIVTGMSEGVQDVAKKFVISAIGALFLASGTFFLTHKGNLLANIFQSLKQESFQEIVLNANSGDTIDVSQKTYYEFSIAIDKNLIIRGDRESAFIGDEDETTLIIKNNAEVTLENLNFSESEIGVFIDENAKVIIKNCVFSENKIAIEAKNATSISIENSFIEKSSDAALHIANVSSGTINRNTLSQNRVGIVAENSSLDISENLIKNSTDNAFYLFSDSSKINKNVINRVFYGAGVNFRKGIHETSLEENVFASIKIGLYSIADADTKKISAKKNTFVKISENEIVLAGSTPENFSENLNDELWTELDIKNVGCDAEVCI